MSASSTLGAILSFLHRWLYTPIVSSLRAILSFLYRWVFGPLVSSLAHEPGLRVADAPVYFGIKDDARATEVRPATIESFIQEKCPSLFVPFESPWWLFNGHLQTLYCVLGDFSKVDKIEYERKLLSLKCGGTVGLDFTPPPSEGRVFAEDTPTIVVMHGLTGGSHESYVRSILAPAITPVAQGGLGYRAVVVNFRGCAGTPITSPQFYSAYHTDDLRQALIYLTSLYPKSKFHGLGFSLGANVLCRYLAEEGENSRLSSGLLMANCWSLVKNNDRLESTWFYRNVYSAQLGQNLVNLFTSHADTLQEKWPDHPLTEATKTSMSWDKKPPISKFDDVVTRIGGGAGAPHGPFPFKDSMDYYVNSSSDYVLPDIRVPLLAINSGDDPIVRALPDPAHNGWVALYVTEGGGHLGWFKSASGGVFELQRWSTKPALEWFKAIGQEAVLEDRKLPALVKKDGWLTDDKHPHLGFKPQDGWHRVVGVEGQDGTGPKLAQGL